MDWEKIGSEMSKLQNEGFSYWLENYFDTTTSALPEDVKDALSDAYEKMRVAQDMLESIRADWLKTLETS